MIWKFLAKTYEEVPETELKLKITIYFMNFKKNWYFDSELLKTKRNMIAWTLSSGLRTIPRKAQDLGNAIHVQPVGGKEPNKIGLNRDS